MRIIGGEFRGRKLMMPLNKGVRPTQDRVRESLFNVLAPYIRESLFLDIFSGTGAVALEAVSRGASCAVMIENDPQGCEVIEKNVKALGVSGRVRVIRKDFLQAIRDLAGKGFRFDIIFMDPPYRTDMAKNGLLAIFNYDIVTSNSLIIIEHYKTDLLPERAGSFELFKIKKFNKKILSFYKCISV